MPLRSPSSETRRWYRTRAAGVSSVCCFAACSTNAATDPWFDGDDASVGDDRSSGDDGSPVDVAAGGTHDSSSGRDAATHDVQVPRDVHLPEVFVPDVQAGDGGISGKRGIAFAAPQYPQDFAGMPPEITWWYDWGLTPNGVPPGGPEFVPMIWNASYTEADLQTKVSVNAKYLLTFNEPNFGNQANLTPQQAAAAWPTLQSFAQGRGIPIVSPAVNYCGGNCNETDPFVWLTDFFAACSQCEVDFIAVHSYVCNTLYSLQPLLQRFESTYHKPLWLTEFSCMDGSLPATAANEAAYMKTAVAALEADPMVFRYAWFTSRYNANTAINLLAGPGQLTTLGQEYAGLPF
jgi:hypothetical protein